MPRLPTSLSASLLVAVLATILLGIVTACDGGAEAVGEPGDLPALRQSTPEQAVRSYLQSVSLAYRLADPSPASETMTADEGVRVDAYIELNRGKGRGIEQRLESFTVRTRSEEGTGSVLAASEKWGYRYFGLDTMRYLSPRYEASYETTYTLVREGGRWLVDRVEAEPLTEVR